MSDLVDADAPEAEPSGASDGTDEESSETAERFVATAPQVLVAGVILIYVWYFTQRSLDIHHALGTASYDSALYDQGVWLLSQGDAPFVTLMGRNLFGDHTSFILLLLVPFYWIWPAAGVLFFSQSLVIGLGALPVFLYGRKRLGSEWYALIVATAYLLHPAIGWTNLENFHPDSFLGVFVGFAIYCALERRWRWYLVSVVLALSVKEDASLVLVPMGVWVAVKRDWKIGIATVLGSVAFMAVAMFVVMRSLIGVPTRNTWRLPFSQPDDSTIRAGWRIIDTAVTNPTALAEHLRSDDRPWYLWQMTAPVAWLFVRLPWIALISALVMFTNILSTFWYQYQIEYHYSLVAVPALSLGTVHAIGALREGRWRGVPVRAAAMGVLAVASLWTTYLWSPVPWGRTELFYGNPNNPWAQAGHAIVEDIPADAIVSAHYRITPHIAHRHEIYQFPTPFRAVLYGPNGNVDGPRIPERAERVEYVVLPVTTDAYPVDDWLLIESAFDLVEINDHWILYERDFDVPLPPPRE
ncbi:MAG: DUF2079 domain-containing protein [Ilumatobacter sp.]|uniref:DUF2079 domain-containing protein n=1 Tax=Ilumatobacter sp. TaxID=1967498 RepID=UPI00391A2A43